MPDQLRFFTKSENVVLHNIAGIVIITDPSSALSMMDNIVLNQNASGTVVKTNSVTPAQHVMDKVIPGLI